MPGGSAAAGTENGPSVSGYWEDAKRATYTNIRIIQTMISCIPLTLGLGTRMSDPYVDVVF